MLLKVTIPFTWSAISLAFKQGTASSVDLAAFLLNPESHAVTYGAASLPASLTLTGSVVSYNGTGAADTGSVTFTATSGPLAIQSDLTPWSIAAVVDSTAPSVPAGLTATAVSSTQINLAWTAATDPIVAGQSTTGVKKYLLRRSTNGTAFAPLASVDAPLTSYPDTGLVAGTRYWYAVAAEDVAGNASATSSAANATTQSAPATGLPWSQRSGGPPWLHGTLNLFAGDAQNPSQLPNWVNWMGHAPDIMGVYMHADTWTQFRSGIGSSQAYLYPTIAFLPHDTPIILSVDMYPKKEPTSTGGAATAGANGGLLNRFNGNKDLAWGSQLWDNFNAGLYDAHYDALADGLIALCAGSRGVGSDNLHRSADDFIIRLGWEMNGDWYAWSIGNNIAKFKQAWARVVARMRVKIPNLWFDFSPGPSYVRGVGTSATIETFTPDPSSYNVLSVSHHDAATISAGGSAATAATLAAATATTVWSGDAATWNRHKAYLDKFMAHAKAQGKWMALTEWASQMDNCDTTYHVLARQPDYYYQKTWEWLNDPANRSNIAWDTQFSPACCSLVSRQSSAAAVYFKSKWGA